MSEPKDTVFEVATPLGFTVRLGKPYWRLIVSIKHPAMVGREDDVRAALEEPDEIRQSRRDSDVFLFYRLERPGRWTCVVAKRLNGSGFVITCYPTDSIKEGERLWPR